MDPLVCRSPQEVVRALAQQVRRIEGGGQAAHRPRISTGCPPLDRCLGGGGLCPGTLVEWLAAEPAGGATTLALRTAAEATRGGVVVVLDRRREFYPPAAAAGGVDLGQMIVVWPGSENEQCWAMYQVLRSQGVGAVLCWPSRLDARVFRRWQLAAESGGCLGLIFRPHTARGQPSWAEVRLLVEPRGAGISDFGFRISDWGGKSRERNHTGREASEAWRLGVTVLRGGKGALGQQTLEIVIDERTGAVDELSCSAADVGPLADPLADPAAHRRAQGA